MVGARHHGKKHPTSTCLVVEVVDHGGRNGFNFSCVIGSAHAGEHLRRAESHFQTEDFPMVGARHRKKKNTRHPFFVVEVADHGVSRVLFFFVPKVRGMHGRALASCRIFSFQRLSHGRCLASKEKKTRHPFFAAVVAVDHGQERIYFFFSYWCRAKKHFHFERYPMAASNGRFDRKKMLDIHCLLWWR